MLLFFCNFCGHCAFYANERAIDGASDGVNEGVSDGVNEGVNYCELCCELCCAIMVIRYFHRLMRCAFVRANIRRA